jgi:hypothetical protein
MILAVACKLVQGGRRCGGVRLLSAAAAGAAAAAAAADKDCGGRREAGVGDEAGQATHLHSKAQHDNAICV